MLKVVDLPDPVPGGGEIAIDVTHAAVGLIDVFLRQGLYKDRPGLPRPPFVPGLEVAGTVRALGDGVTGFAVGERVVSMSGTGSGGYASVHVGPAYLVASTEGYDLDPALVVSVVPNAAMAHVAFTRVLHLAEGESVLVHGALGGFAAAFPGIARQLGATRVAGTVRAGKLAAAAATRLPYDQIVDSADLPGALGDEKFDVVIDPVGGVVRTRSLDLMKPGAACWRAGTPAATGAIRSTATSSGCGASPCPGSAPAPTCRPTRSWSARHWRQRSRRPRPDWVTLRSTCFRSPKRSPRTSGWRAATSTAASY